MRENAEAAISRTLPIHDTCHHLHYLLSCDQFEALIAEAGNACQVCGLPGAENSQGKLFIDHVGGWNWAVRGLLCNSCNTTLGKDNEVPRNESFARYLANPWYVRQLAAKGISVEGPPEPPENSRVRDHQGRIWRRCGQYWHTRDSRLRNRTWSAMLRRSGPLGLTRIWTDHLTLQLDDASLIAEELAAHMRPELLDELRRLLSARSLPDRLPAPSQAE